MKVLVLGAGPAGLIAAHSAALHGADDIRILSKKGRKSMMNGAQYLHQPIPEATNVANGFRVNYRLLGSPEDYRRKVYGPTWDGTVSPEDLEQSHFGWDIRDTYDFLWDCYAPYVIDFDATPNSLDMLLATANADILVNSVPAPLLCSQGHLFQSTKIWSTNYSMKSDLDNNQVLCNGIESPAWYRASKIMGCENTEWPGHIKPPVTPLWEVVKPLTTNCDCPDKIAANHGVKLVKIGRYGRWTKGILSHEGFDDTMNAMKNFQEGLW